MAQRGRPRKYPSVDVVDRSTTPDTSDTSSVRVQMSDDPDDLDRLLQAATAPRRPPVHDDPNIDPDPNAPPHRQPESPDVPDPVRSAPDKRNPIPPPNLDDPDGSRGNNEEADDWEDRPADPPLATGAIVANGTLDRPDSTLPEVSQRPRDPQAAARPIEGEILPPPPRPADPSADPIHRKYESRITIVDAWQYPGTLSQAPDWIDRNWAAWADYDQLRGLEPGPALRVPTHGEGYREALCRIGDFVARQEVKLLADIPGEIKLEVWEKEQFERLFIPAEPAAAHAA